MTQAVSREEVIMPGGIELMTEAEPHMGLAPAMTVLSVACGTGELELYLAEKYGCQVTGVDSGEGFIRRAREKAASRKLDHLASFEVGDGNALRFDASSFDVVFCSGALCAFFQKGLREFHRVLKPGGKCAIIEVVWRDEHIPPETVQRWTEGTAHVLTVTGNREAFQEQGFRVLFSREYDEPSWWEAYYEDRGNAPHWSMERDNYQRDRAHLGLGLFVVQKP